VSKQVLTAGMLWTQRFRCKLAYCSRMPALSAPPQRPGGDPGAGVFINYLHPPRRACTPLTGGAPSPWKLESPYAICYPQWTK